MTKADSQQPEVDQDHNTDDSTQELIHQLMVVYRQDVLSRIQEAQNLSEGAVLGVGESVDSIVEETRDYIENLRQLLGSLSDDQSEANIAHIVMRQSNAVAYFMSDMNKHLRSQEDNAQQAVNQSMKIIETANALKTMAYTAKILSLNAHIEASRLGQHGRAFQVIVKEMLRFSEMVEETNLQVSLLAQELQELLPQIALQTRTIRRDSENFSEELETLNGSVETSTHALKDKVMDTVSEGDVRLQRVLDLSLKTLSLLQFQDPMIQEIQRIDSSMFELHSKLNEAADSNREPEPPTFELRMGDLVEREGPEGDEAILEQGDFIMF